MKRAGTSRSGAARKPPEPTSHTEIENWIHRQMPDLQPILRHIDARIRKQIPNLQYSVKWQRPYYGLLERGWIVELASYDVSVNIVFLNGANFDDPPTDGTGSSRYVKVRSVEEANAPEIGDWIEEATEHQGWRLGAGRGRSSSNG